MTTNSTFYVSRHAHVWAGGTIRTELISFKRSQTPVKIRWVDAYLLGLFTGRGVDVGSENIG